MSRNYYDKIYSQNQNFCGYKPNKLLVGIRKNLTPGSRFLDLGCGQGRDSFYMARNGFEVMAVDNSKVAISQIEILAKNKKLSNLKSICQNISDFKIEPKKYSLINSINSLQFLPEKEVLETIKNIQKNILPGGFVIIQSFTKNNPPSKRRLFHFETEELKKLFSLPDFEIIHYREKEIIDSGHIGAPKPHKHEIVDIIAKKIN